MTKKKDPSIARANPGRKPTQITIDIKIEYVPCPPEKADAWRRGLLLLLDILMEDAEPAETGARAEIDHLEQDDTI